MTYGEGRGVSGDQGLDWEAWDAGGRGLYCGVFPRFKSLCLGKTTFFYSFTLTFTQTSSLLLSPAEEMRTSVHTGRLPILTPPKSLEAGSSPRQPPRVATSISDGL